MTFLKKFWEGWKRFGQFMGDVFGRLVLTIFYFTVFVPFGLGVRFFSDPLRFKIGQSSSYWQEREARNHTTEEGNRQF